MLNVSMVFVLYETGTFLWVIPLQWEEKMLETWQDVKNSWGTKRYLAVAEKCYEGAICTIFDLVTAKWLGRKMVSYSFHISFIYYFQSRSSRGMFPQDCLLKDGLIYSKLSSLHLNHISTISRRCFSYDFTYFSLPKMIPATTVTPGGWFIGQGSVRRFRGPSRMLRNSFAWPSPRCLGQRHWWRLKMCKKGKQGAGSSSDITLINYTYIQYIYCIYIICFKVLLPKKHRTWSGTWK